MSTSISGRIVDEFADVRTGDKGDTLILSVFSRSHSDHILLAKALTAELVSLHYGHLATGPVRRTELASLHAIVFELPGILGGGVTGSPTLDGHGKTLSYHLLTLQL